MCLRFITSHCQQRRNSPACCHATLAPSVPQSLRSARCLFVLPPSAAVPLKFVAPIIRGAVSSAVPGATETTAKPATFDHPTWAVKRLSSVTTLEEVSLGPFLLLLLRIGMFRGQYPNGHCQESRDE